MEHFHRKAWNETWIYPSGSLIAIDREFPALANFYFSWETSYVPFSLMKFSRTRYWLAPLVVTLYIIFVYFGPKIMENRKAFDLKTPLKYWNLLLAIFSFIGMLRIVPHLVYFMWKVGFSATLCTPPVWSFGFGAAGLWTVLFIYSKYFELIDTVFIVLRKRDLSFLHWYHHATVLLYTWDAFITEQPPGIHFCAMNYTVHALMYFYYYLAATMKSPPKWGIIVTVLQIGQMLVGVAITLLSIYLSFTYPFIPSTTSSNAFRPLEIPGCYLSKPNLFGCIAMYSTYFYLFAEFFWARYISKPSGSGRRVQSEKKIQ